MKLSRVLLPIVWPMVAVFALGAALGLAVPRKTTDPQAVATSTPQPSDAPSEVPSTSGPEGGGGKKNGGATESPEKAGEDDDAPPSPTASAKPSPTTSPTNAPLVCTDKEKVLIVNLIATGETELRIDLLPDRTDLDLTTDVEDVREQIAGLVSGKSDVVALVSGEIERTVIEALIAATAEKRLWIVAESDDRSAWSALRNRVFSGDMDTELTDWLRAKLKCLFSEA